jgi:hypothetical protein
MKRLFTLAAILLSLLCHAQTVFIETEQFSKKGGWVTDPQFYDQIGSSYLLAHGNGTPVADATTVFEVKTSGNYQIMARTRNWVSNWFAKNEYAPGLFKIKVDETLLHANYGNEGKEWHFQRGDVIYLEAGKHTLSLVDQTGFGARCDVIALSMQPDQDMFKSFEALQQYRSKLCPAKQLSEKFDLVVVGGGVAGISAALKAARSGLKVCLINNRPVWGGNNSVEHKIVVSGDVQVPPFPGLGAIVNEFKDIYKNPEFINALLAREKNIFLMPNIIFLSQSHRTNFS